MTFLPTDLIVSRAMIFPPMAACRGISNRCRSISSFSRTSSLPAALLGVVAVDDHAQRIDAVAVDQDVHLHQVADAEADQVVVHRAVAARGGS